MANDLEDLLQRVRSANGSDENLDRDIARFLDVAKGGEADTPSYTSSVDTCIHLIERVLPGWHWHVGYGPKGVMPYASLSHGDTHYEAMAATGPLALLTAMLEAKTDDGAAQQVD